MKKTSEKKSNRISALFLLPIIALVIALPVFLTILVEAPIGGSNTRTETSMTDDSGTNEDHSDGRAGNLNSGDAGASDTSSSSQNDAGVGDASSPSPDGVDANDASSTTQDGTETALSASPQEAVISGWEQPFSLSDVSPYSGELYAVINNNIPFFPKTTDATESFETYAELDSLGRCGTACANVGQDLMPTEPRGEIGQVRPSGWHTVKYDGIDGNYLYNRCHLIAYQLAGENANERNLITGTRSFNASGMLPFEEMVGDYVRETNHHVLYRVTPMYHGNNLVANGVLMEAWSVEDDGAGICFNVFVYNVQPGIVIDYATGDSYSTVTRDVADASPDSGNIGETGSSPDGDTADSAAAPVIPPQADTPTPQDTPDADYILNTNTHKFHYPNCSSVQEMAERNKLPFSGNRDEVIAMGYVPCKRCNP